MNGLRAGGAAGAHHGVDAEVRLGGGSGADADGLVGELRVQGLGIGLGINRYGGYAKTLAGADDAGGDFAPVGD